MKVGVLTSSRADFGIYIPLLEQLKSDAYFELEIIAFGTHLSKNNGYTISEIKDYGFTKIHQIDTLLESDTPAAIANSIGNTCSKFSAFWGQNTYDLVLCLGDRYEMFAAVSAASPFNINIGHIHAGETTLGAIDNAYRHSISLFSKYLFVSTEEYKKRAQEVVHQSAKVFNVGALSIDNLKNIDFIGLKEFNQKFNIDLSKPTILSTFHPETINFEANKSYIKELIKSFDILRLDYQIVITLPNTDTMGEMVRNEIIKFGESKEEIKIVESFGMVGYLSCMKHCSFLLGNTSSGFVEASYFPKYVINIGDRQKGRILTENILSCKVDCHEILKKVNELKKKSQLEYLNTYGEGYSASRIVKIIKENNE